MDNQAGTADVFTLLREHRAARHPDALAGLLQLGCGDPGRAAAEAARRYLREEAGWHGTIDAAGAWTFRRCRTLRRAGHAGAVCAVR